MAVVVRPEDVDAFIAACNKENIDAVVVATVTEKPNLVMHWNGETIVDLERRFLDTNGRTCELFVGFILLQCVSKMPGV